MIGARNPLIAFNIYLTTDEVDIAKKIAKAVRNSSGGLRHVKALGLLVEGRAQVSMNLTNFHETPIARVVEMVRREAERYGVGIHHSELVGLIPHEALVDAAVWYTQLDAFDKEQVLETRIVDFSTSPAQPKPVSFIEELAAPTATPGGGSAGAYAGAMGAGTHRDGRRSHHREKEICRRRSPDASYPRHGGESPQGIDSGRGR